MRKWLLSIRVPRGVDGVVTPVYAQNAQITGVLKDQSGGVLPGVTLTARNAETGLTRTAVSGPDGEYRYQPCRPERTHSLPSWPDSPRKSAPASSWSSTRRRSLIFYSSPRRSPRPSPFRASPRSWIPRRRTWRPSVSNEQIQDLPVASRRWLDLAMLTPGTSQDNIRGFFYRGNVNVGAGTREYSNGFVVDGVNNTWAEMGEPRQNFAMDSIREFKVSTSNYKAEYGLATGGLVTVVSKSGTNVLHGSGLLFFRDKALTARTFFEPEKPDFERYQYGGTIGGPIIADKTHFFFAYEGTQESQFFTVNTGGIFPSADGTYPSDQDRWTYTAKVDHQINANQSVFFRYAQEDEYRPIITAGGRTHPTASFDFAVPRNSAVLAHTWILNERMVNDFRFQYGFSKYEVAPPYSHGSWEPGYFGEDRLAYCEPVFSLSVTATRRLRQHADGSRDPMAVEGRLRDHDAELEGDASVEVRVRLQLHRVPGRHVRLTGWQLDVPSRPALRRRRTRSPSRRSSNTRCRRMPTSRCITSPSICRTTGRSDQG